MRAPVRARVRAMEVFLLSAGNIVSAEPYTSFIVNGVALVEAPPGITRLLIPGFFPSHVLVTHQHGDHLLGLPQLLFRALSTGRELDVYMPQAAAAALKRVLEAVYPDLTPELSVFALRLHVVRPRQSFVLPGGLEVEPLPAKHTVPGMMYMFRSNGVSLLYTGDTGYTPPLEKAVADADAVIIECNYPDGVETDFHLNTAQVEELARRHPEKPFLVVDTPLRPSDFQSENVFVASRLPASLIVERRGGALKYSFG